MSRETKWGWSPGFHGRIPAEIAGSELLRIHKAQGLMTAAAVVDEARPPSSLLHPQFEWDDARAAEEHRRNQARNLINSIRVLVIGDKPSETRALIQFYRVRDDAGSRYVTTIDIGTNGALRASALAECAGILKGVRERFGQLQEIRPICRAIDRFLESRRSPARKRAAS